MRENTAPRQTNRGKNGTIVTVSNRKGGVGKTTTVINAGAALAKLGFRVLLVDMDGQRNLSHSLDLDTSAPGMYEALQNGTALNPLEVCENLFAVPASTNLAFCEISLSQRTDGRTAIAKLLKPLASSFDVVLIDTPPALGFLTVGSLAASDYVLIPTTAEPLAADGVKELLSIVEDVRTNLNASLKLAGVVLTLYDKRPKIAAYTVDKIRAFVGDAILNTRITRSVAIQESTLFAQDLLRYDPKCKAAKEFTQLAEEIAERLKLC